MRKTLRAILGFVLMALPGSTQAQYNYTTNNGKITITRYTGTNNVVTIPDTISNLPVTSIGPTSFLFLNNLIGVTIPDTVTNIGSRAFMYCGSLTSVTIGNSVTSIGDYTFNYCTNLTSIVIPDSVSIIGIYAFASCSILTNTTIGNGSVSIGNYAFYECSNLTSVITGTNVTSIGDYAFYNCTNLTSFIIPDNVTNIGYSAFKYCSSLTDVTIGNSVTNIGDGAFWSCTSMTGIIVDVANSFYSSEDGVLFNKNQTSLIQYPGGKNGSYTIPSNITNIQYWAFYCHSRLTSVIIPSSITTIDIGIFQRCTSLTNVTIPNSVLVISGGAFAFCTSLGDVTIPSSVISIDFGAFYSCTNMTNITVDATNARYSSVDGVLYSKNHGWLCQYPGGIAGSYTTLSNVTFIANQAFAVCPNLTSVTIPDSVNTLGSYAFEGCTNLASVFFKGNTPRYDFDWTVFSNANNATVYYMPGTTNWGPTFCGRPTVLWNPSIEPGAPSFGMGINNFGFNINGTTNIPIVVQACTNLENAIWVPLLATNLTVGSVRFSDPEWTNYPARFYNIRWP